VVVVVVELQLLPTCSAASITAGNPDASSSSASASEQRQSDENRRMIDRAVGTSGEAGDTAAVSSRTSSSVMPHASSGAGSMSLERNLSASVERVTCHDNNTHGVSMAFVAVFCEHTARTTSIVHCTQHASHQARFDSTSVQRIQCKSCKVATHRV
jgi:hypothetical protein